MFRQTSAETLVIRQYRIIEQERFASKFCVLTRRGVALISVLVNVLEFELADDDRRIFLDAHFLELRIDACGLEHAVHILTGLVVVEVDRAHDLVHPCAGNDVGVAVALDGPVVLGDGSRLGIVEVRGEHE